MESSMAEKATGFTSALEGALWCAKQGMAVFPLRRSGDVPNQKRPVVTDWENRASTDPAKIVQWEAEFPGSNWAVACGPSGLVVIDVDRKAGKDGHKNLETLELDHGPLLDTLSVITASGSSVHRYYRGLTKSANSALAPGVDVKSAGGYVVAPGSIFRDASGKSLGQYYIEEERPVAALASWIAAALAPRKVPAGTIAEKIAEGQRDQELTSIAGSMRQRGLDAEEIYAALAVVNSRRCNPPVDDTDLHRITKSVCRYAPGSAKEIGAAIALERASPPPATTDLLPCAGDLLADEPAPRPWIVPGRYLRGAMSLTVGPGGSSKSSFALLEGIAIALGRSDIAGMRYPQEQKTVWYYNAEDSLAEIQRRILGVCMHHQIDLKALKRFFYSSGVDGDPLKLAASDHHGKVILNQPALDFVQQQVQRISAELVILDPWAGIHACDENANIEIDQVARKLTRMAVDGGFALHVIHHSRKLGLLDGSGDAEITRGASSLVAAARYACTIRGMSEKDAVKHSIPHDVRHRYCRLDDAKLNYSEASDTAIWFMRENVALSPNAGPAQGVAVLVPVDLAHIVATESHVSQLLAAYLATYEDAPISVNRLAAALKSVPELADDFSGAPGTNRRKLLNMLSRPLALEGGRMAVIRTEGSVSTVYIEEDFIL